LQRWETYTKNLGLLIFSPACCKDLSQSSAY
jgi:hypothetical protein